MGASAEFCVTVGGSEMVDVKKAPLKYLHVNNRCNNLCFFPAMASYVGLLVSLMSTMESNG